MLFDTARIYLKIILHKTFKEIPYDEKCRSKGEAIKPETPKYKVREYSREPRSEQSAHAQRTLL